jgi:hypothetical protein
MNKHQGKDYLTRAKFQIVGLDEAAGVVELKQSKDGWVSEFEEITAMPWASFIEGLMEGRLEIISQTRRIPPELADAASEPKPTS